MSEAFRHDDGLRQAYLQAMGITEWECRHDLPPQTLEQLMPALERAGAVLPPTTDWNTLANAVAQCSACELSTCRTQTVLGSGSHDASWLIVGEAPGEQEDLQGQPFVGRAGQLLTEMLRAVGLERERVYIANVLKCRPPGNRDPLPAEVAQCMPFLQQQQNLLKPRIIVAVGRIAAQNVLGTTAPLSELRGKVHDHAGVPLVVTYHPAYLLRAPREKAKAWQDLMLARKTHDLHG